ncbi:hypothetical protein N9B94_03100 [Verrucomicrobia bacterium]|nr:hypothetical protein [Verrucomicrobiota bacterium]
MKTYSEFFRIIPFGTAVQISCVCSLLFLSACSDGDSSELVSDVAVGVEPMSPDTPEESGTVVVMPTETMEEKNVRMAKLYGDAEKNETDTEQKERASHAEAELSKLSFSWTESPSFRKAGGRAFLDLDAQDMVAGSGKKPVFSRDGRVVVPPSPTLALIRKAYAEKDWLTLINIGGKATYSSYPSIKLIDSAVKDLRSGPERGRYVEPYQLYVWFPEPIDEVGLLSLYKFSGRGAGYRVKNVLHSWPSNRSKTVLEFDPSEKMQTLIVGASTEQGFLYTLGKQHKIIVEGIYKKVKMKDIDAEEGRRLRAKAMEQFDDAYATWVKKN